MDNARSNDQANKVRREYGVSFTEKQLTEMMENSIFGFFPSVESLVEILSAFPPSTVEAGTEVARQGEMADELIIPLSEPFELFVAGPNPGSQVKIGELARLRSLALNAVLRGQAHPHTARATKRTVLFRIPSAALNKRLEAAPGVRTYLLLLTENVLVRQMKKNLEELGCSKTFYRELIGSMEQRSASPQEWIAREKVAPDAALILEDGDAQAYRQGKSATLQALWTVPPRVFQFARECLEGQPLSYSVRASSKLRYFAVRREILSDLAERFPEDFSKLLEWAPALSSGADDEIEGSGLSREEFAEIFSEAPNRKKQKGAAFPFISQNEDGDSASACMAMLAKFYDHPVPIQFWREQLVTTIGSVANQSGLVDIARAAEKFGFTTSIAEVEDLDTLGESFFPIIAVHAGAFKTVYEVRNGKAMVADPLQGLARVELKDFATKLDKTVLLLRPLERFYAVNAPTSAYSHYVELFRPNFKEIAMIIACSAALVVLASMPPILVQIIIDEVLAKKDESMLLTLFGAASVLIFAQSAVGWLKAYYMAYISAKLDFRACSAFMRKLFSLPFSFFAARHTGDFIHRLWELQSLREFVTGPLLKAGLDIVTLVIYGAVLATYSIKVAALSFLLAPVLVFSLMIFSRRLSERQMEALNSRSEQDSLLADYVRGIPVIKSLGAEVIARWRFEEKTVECLKAEYEIAKTSATMGIIASGLDRLARFFILAVSAYFAIRGELSPGQVFAVSMVSSFVFDPFLNLANSWPMLQNFRSIVSRLNDVFLTHSEVAVSAARKSHSVSKAKLRGEIEFRDVWFRYGGENSDWVLRGVSFKIEPGQRVAIVGESGAGKSTIAALLSRLYLPTKGQILVDGRDYRDYDIEWYRSKFGVLFQESHLFEGTIMENIAFGGSEINEAKAVTVAKIVGAHEFIKHKPNTYEHPVAHGGQGFSGGEMQRISLARTLYRDPAVLLLDEATSALDGIAERSLVDSLRHQSKAMTVINIAHRYSTVLGSDFALVLRAGNVVEFGTHEELSKRGGVYCELFGLGAYEKAS